MSDDDRVRIDVRFPEATRQCAVHLGAGLLGNSGALIAELVSSRRAVIVCDSAIAQTHAQTAAQSLAGRGFETAIIPMDASEERKSLQSVADLYAAFLDFGLDRAGPVIALGGGIITDTAGFAAATFMRGVPLINAPTTLLGMVDAAIGGKTGVNFPLPGSETLGKNLIGAIHQPVAVLMDVEALTTLPPRFFACGLAECIKHALIADPDMLEWMESNVESLAPQYAADLVSFIARHVEIKCDIVRRDERESGVRMLLNLGHTFAHAIETRPELNLEHGEAVALGLLAACAAGEHLGMTEPSLRRRLAALLPRLGLPTRLAQRPPMNEVLAAMQSDKKSRSGSIRLIIPIAAGVVEVVDSPPPEAVQAGLDAVFA